MSYRIPNSNARPTIINRELLENLILKQAPTNESKHLLTENGIQLNLVTVLRLDFLNITKIDHLWMLKSLKKLSLSHNKIELIENLEMLVNLEELDLSFNLIGKIENLSRLTNIEVLMLNNNQIDTLENVDNLTKIMILSLSGNSIEDYQQVTYLRQFKQMRCLSLRENPCCDNPQCYTFVKAILPQLKYLDYVAVSKEEKEKCQSQYTSLINNLKKEENEAERVAKEKQKNNAIFEINLKSFVEYLDGDELFIKMFQSDKDGIVLLNVGEQLINEYNNYKSDYSEIMKTFITFAHDQHRVRGNEIKMFQDVIDAARNESIKRSREAKENFIASQEEKKTSEIEDSNKIEQDNDVIKDSNKTEQDTDMTQDSNQIEKDKIDELWRFLMSEEMVLYEQCEETRKELEENMKVLLWHTIDTGKTKFADWRNREIVWIEKLKAFYNKLISREITTELLEIQYLLAEPEVLMDIINLSQENHIKFINERENVFQTRINDWSENFFKQMQWDEINRNRGCILEISKFIENLKLHHNITDS